MKLFAGLSSTDYQDLLRAIGAQIDAQGLRDIRIWEHEDGIVVQGRRAERDGGYTTILLNEDDLGAILAEAYRRRGASPPSRLA